MKEQKDGLLPVVQRKPVCRNLKKVIYSATKIYELTSASIRTSTNSGLVHTMLGYLLSLGCSLYTLGRCLSMRITVPRRQKIVGGRVALKRVSIPLLLSYRRRMPPSEFWVTPFLLSATPSIPPGSSQRSLLSRFARSGYAITTDHPTEPPQSSRHSTRSAPVPAQ